MSGDEDEGWLCPGCEASWDERHRADCPEHPSIQSVRIGQEQQQ